MDYFNNGLRTLAKDYTYSKVNYGMDYFSKVTESKLWNGLMDYFSKTTCILVRQEVHTLGIGTGNAHASRTSPGPNIP